MITTTLYASGTTYIDAEHSDSNYSTAINLKCSNSCLAIAQFEIPSTMQYKVINKVTLHNTLQSTYSGDTTSYKTYGYITADSLMTGSITYDTYSSNAYGMHSNLQGQSVFDYKTLSGTSLNITDDITKYYMNAVTNNIFTFVCNWTGDFSISSSNFYIVIEYEDVNPVAPTLISPVLSYVNRDDEITFSWAHNTNSGAKQKSFTLIYQNITELNSSEITVTNEQEETSILFGAKTFGVGTYTYKLATTDITGLTSPYSTSEFTVLGAPNIPVIYSIDSDKCLPKISWNSTTQQSGYSIKIYKDSSLVYTAEETTNDNFHDVNKVLENSDYELRMTIGNIYGYTSEEAIYLFSINATSTLDKPRLLTVQRNNYIELRNLSNSTKVILYKKENGFTYYPIYIFTENNEVFYDYNIKRNTDYRYYTKAIDDGYIDSDICTVALDFNGMCITDSITNDNLNIITSADEQMTYQNTLQNNCKLQNFAGREYPVAEFSVFNSNTISRKFVLTIKESQILKTMYNNRNILLYRDEYYNNFYCVITQFNIMHINNFDDKVEVQLTIQQIDFNEEVNII